MASAESTPEFSLIISTIGQAERLRQGLESIIRQTYDSFEVIVVDQNTTDHVFKIVSEFAETGRVFYTKSAVGLSKGRNAALAKARGRIVGFPDDDCEYSPTLLADVKARFLAHDDVAGICIRCCDHDGRDSAGRSDRIGGEVTKTNVWSRAISVGIFLKTSIIKDIGGFDENIGLGSNTPYLSGEETDLILSIISRGHRLHYDPSLSVFHPRGSSSITSYHIRRAYAYGLGKGLVLRRYNYRKREILIYCARPVIGAVWAILCGNVSLARFRLARAKGRFEGWICRYPVA